MISRKDKEEWQTSGRPHRTPICQMETAEKKVLREEGEEGVDGEEEEDVWYLRRLEGGLYTLQMVDYVLAWVMMEDDGVSPLHMILGLFVRFFTLTSLTFFITAWFRSEHTRNR